MCQIKFIHLTNSDLFTYFKNCIYQYKLITCTSKFEQKSEFIIKHFGNLDNVENYMYDDIAKIDNIVCEQ